MYNKSIVLLNELKNRKLLLRKMNRIIVQLMHAFMENGIY